MQDTLINPLTAPLTDVQEAKLQQMLRENPKEVLEVAFKALKDAGIEGIVPQQVALLPNGQFVVNVQMNFARFLPARAMYNALLPTADQMLLRMSIQDIEEDIKAMVKNMPNALRQAADTYDEAIKKAGEANESHLYGL